MNVVNTRLCLLLHSLPDIDDTALGCLLLHFGGPRAVAHSDPDRWPELGLPASLARASVQALAEGRGGQGIDIDGQLQALTRTGAYILPISDERYPPLLRTIHDPPPLLYVRGDCALLSRAQLAMVGSRRASPAGLRAAGSLAGQLVQSGLAVGSGLARGIDGAAHRGALAAGGSSVAVMATGVDRVYPASHRGLAEELVESGCLVSEFPPGIPPLRHNFPRRNRIISGLALGVVVIEAALPSGSLITARTAMEQGREVFALPWSIFHSRGAGCLHLIKDGAKMVQTVTDVLEELGALYALQQELCTLPGEIRHDSELSAGQRAILEQVGFEAASVDELVAVNAMPVGQVLAALSVLEMHGLIKRYAGGYIRC
jgi:DNA processing protein